MADAHSSRVGQSSITERNDRNLFGSDIDANLRQIVLERKPKKVRDPNGTIGQSVPMGEAGPAEYKAGFLGRVRAAREAQFETQGEIARALGMEQPTYGKYETRSFLPHWLIDRFCAVCHISPEWLITGRGAGPRWQSVHPSGKKRKRTKKPRRAA